ncbi:MAG: Smr/MutS family protein [Deltaproteobacteria bacterium]|jgi:DNA mismatch repair protein MutS2|nr:Smr/MutS family protein [Deltaproteobacteria bacterium]
MDARSLNILEFPKLLEALAGFAVSEAGAAACRSLAPAASLDELEVQADFFVQGRLWLEATGYKLINFPSLEGVLDLLEKGSPALEADALWILRQVLSQAGNLVESIQTQGRDPGSGEIQWQLLAACCAETPLPVRSLGGLQRCLADDGFIRDEASPELALVRGELRRLHQQCNRKVGDFAREYNIGHYLQDEYITLASDRYVLPLKSNFKGRLQGIIHDYSQTGETCYFEPMFLVDLNNRLQELKREEREEERKILAYLSGLLASELPLLRGIYRLLVRLDVLQAKHRLGQKLDGQMLNFVADGAVCLKEARHPLLALAHAQRLEDEKVGKSANLFAPAPVPSDILLEPDQRVLIISGGNAGGKTVSLKTLGLLTLMGMCAMPVPAAKGGSLPFWPFILPFIGDDQSLEDHVSTFTAQITQLAAHWPKIGPQCLVILDEFGAGTDPSQGAALAQAVLDELLEKGAYVFAATHFPALKAYALSRDKVRAASVLFDPASKKPLYRLVYDQVGASQALEVAKEHGLPESVLKRAQQYLLLDGEDTGLLIERLNSLAVEREGEIRDLQRESSAYRQKRARLEERFELERKKLFQEIQGEAQTVLRDWKASRVTHKQALKALAQARGKLVRDPNGLNEGDDADLAEAGQSEQKGQLVQADFSGLLVGQTTVYAPWNKKGQILELDERRGRVRLDFSGVTMWVALADLGKSGALSVGQAGQPDRSGKSGQAGSAKAGSASSSGSIILPRAANTIPRLDLRGKRADFALAELASYIDSAIMGGRDSIEVLHGRGTGALRREVHLYLKDNPAVNSFALAPEDQGGDGVTLVVLK